MKPITIVLTENYSDWEIGTLAGVGRGFYGADIRFASPNGGPVLSIAGLHIAKTEAFSAPQSGVVVVCGSPIFESCTSGIEAELRNARSAGCAIAGICGGTIALARASLLDDIEHTSNGTGYLQRNAPEYRGEDVYVDRPGAVSSKDVITAPATAPASFAAAVLVAAGLQPELATELQNMLSREHRR